MSAEAEAAAEIRMSYAGAIWRDGGPFLSCLLFRLRSPIRNGKESGQTGKFTYTPWKKGCTFSPATREKEKQSVPYYSSSYLYLKTGLIPLQIYLHGLARI